MFVRVQVPTPSSTPPEPGSVADLIPSPELPVELLTFLPWVGAAVVLVLVVLATTLLRVREF